MNTRTLANHYVHLTAEERFRLILAAGSRGDESEQERLVTACKRISLSMADHAPYSHAFHDVFFLTYIELLADAAFYLDCSSLAGRQLRDSIASSKSRKRRPKPAGNNQTTENDAVEWPDWHHTGRTEYAAGFLFKVKMEGWKRFCARLGVPPDSLWEQIEIPGLERLKRALALAHAGAAFPTAEEMTRWVNEVRPAGEPEHTEANLMTAERFAGGLDKLFRERVRWWGGS